jgi:nitrite reductase/ring-hydroxylating ferredoxin subunit
MITDAPPHDVRWHPVAHSADLRPGANIVAGFAEGQELALWRSAGGAAQAWENRCPHRSVRFTLGQVIEDRLSCAYHGWQYAAGNGQCVSIPAHPAMQAPRNVCAKVFGAVDAAGMLWVNLAQDARRAAIAGRCRAGRLALLPHADAACRCTGRARCTRTARLRGRRAPGAFQGALDTVKTVALMLDAQPQLTFIHLWTEAPPGSDAMKTLHAAARNLRSAIETQG